MAALNKQYTQSAVIVTQDFNNELNKDANNKKREGKHSRD